MKTKPYIWQDELEDLQTSIHCLKEIMESRRYRNEDCSDLIDTINELKEEIKQLEEKNK